MKRHRIYTASALVLGLSFGLTQTSFAQTISLDSLLAPFLEEFSQVFTTELTNVISSTVNASPLTQSIFQGITSTIGSLGLPIPINLKQVAQQATQQSSQGLFQPYGDNQNLADFVSANTVADTAANAVMGEAGQTDITNVLNTTSDAWLAAVDIIQTDAGNSINEVQQESDSIQNVTSTLDALKGLARQNATMSLLHQQIGASQVEIGQTVALQANTASKQIVLGAGQLQLQKLSANGISAIQNNAQVQAAGASSFLAKNAMQFSCLSIQDCQ